MEELIKKYNEKKKYIIKRLENFKNVKDIDLFYELCFCILTPQSSGKQCWEAVLRLKEADFQNKPINPDKFVYPIRFYKNKSRYLIEFKEKFTPVRNEINKYNKNKESPQLLRDFLLKNIKGYGYKEASHSLRNIGFTGLAILDRHIMKNLKNHGAIKSLPKTLTKKHYLAIENKFKRFSKKIGIPMDHLDLLFWSNETGEIFK